MQKYFNNVTNRTGDVVPGAIVTVTLSATGALATIYSDDGVTTRANPITADNNGYFEFYAADGLYDLAITGSGIQALTISDVLIEDLSDLTGGEGASLVGYLPAGTGATLRTVQAKLREVVSVSDFGAVGGGVVDDRGAFLAAMTALGSKGGTVLYFDKHLIDSSLTVPANVTIKGPMGMVGSPGTNTSAPYGNMAALIVNSAATITLSGGAGVDGVMAYRKGMTFPAADSSAFAGTLFTAAGDDCFVVNSMALGFNKAYYSSGYQRPRIQNFNFDCVNGIDIQNCLDIARVSNCQGWPFATIAALGAASTLQRSGTAFNFAATGDWNKLTDCFAYGYSIGYLITDCNSMTLLSCSADNTNTGFGTGFSISGGCEDTRLIACQAAAQLVGYTVNTTAGLHTQLQNCAAWSNTNHGILINGGDATILGGVNRDTANGVSIASASSVVEVDFVRFKAISGSPINAAVGTSKVRIGACNDYGGLAAGNAVAGANAVVETIASADPLNLPTNGEVFNVTGTTSFGSLNGGSAGRKVTLIFAGVLSVFSSTGSTASMRLSGGATFTSAANSSLTLRHNGVQWIEVARSA